MEAIREEVRALMMNLPADHDWTHTERVIKNALHIAKIEGANLEIVELAAILHDIAREKEDETGEGGEVCHAVEGARMAEQILEKHGYTENIIKPVADCIRTHRFRDKQEPQTLEAKVLYDADKLDALGAIGITRAFAYGARFSQKLYSDFSAEHEHKTGLTNHSEHTPVVEFQMKLSKLKDRMLTSEGRRLAVKRHNFMINFYKELEQEVSGEI